MLAAGVYLLSHTGANFGSIANHLARDIELDPRRPFIRHPVARLGQPKRNEIELFGAGAIAYGALALVEGIGLFLRQRWAEWLTVVARGLLVPLAFYELVRKPSLLKGAGLAVNSLIVLYLARVVRRKAA